MNQTDNSVLLMVIVIVTVFVLVLLVKLVSRINAFSEELRYINMELGRCSAHMRPKWLRRRRRLWCSLFIPFYKY